MHQITAVSVLNGTHFDRSAVASAVTVILGTAVGPCESASARSHSVHPGSGLFFLLSVRLNVGKTAQRRTGIVHLESSNGFRLIQGLLCGKVGQEGGCFVRQLPQKIKCNAPTTKLQEKNGFPQARVVLVR